MDCSSHPRIDNRTWNRRVATLAVDAAGAHASEEARLLREARALLAMAPAVLAGRFARLPRPVAFEAMISCGAGESAAMALLPADAAYIVSRGGNGVHLASVIFDGMDEEVAAEAPTGGLAMLAAMAGALRISARIAGAGARCEAVGQMADAGVLH